MQTNPSSLRANNKACDRHLIVDEDILRGEVEVADAARVQKGDAMAELPEVGLAARLVEPAHGVVRGETSRVNETRKLKGNDGQWERERA